MDTLLVILVAVAAFFQMVSSLSDLAKEYLKRRNKKKDPEK